MVFLRRFLLVCGFGLPLFCWGGTVGGLSPKRAQVVAALQHEIGVMESGYNAGPRVNQYLRATGNRPGEYWCGAFIGFIYRLCGLPIPAGAGAARSWFPAASPQTFFIKGSRGNIDAAQPGDLLALYYVNLGRIGHILALEKQLDNAVITIEGNTGPDGGRNGDGVYRKRRMKRGIYAAANRIGL